MVGLGTHEQLLRECEEYREIVESQFSPEEAAR
jgi:ATP-binding cassette subfamily B protein